jgi:C4-dicarboxylate-specific signal transduction histidine kinase
MAKKALSKTSCQKGCPRRARRVRARRHRGGVARRLDAIHQELRFELTRPGERVIEVERNAAPGAGFVLIYGEITERKRSEPEIRAARDVAEAACLDLKAAQATLIQVEKMAALRQLTPEIAHGGPKQIELLCSEDGWGELTHSLLSGSCFETRCASDPQR